MVPFCRRVEEAERVLAAMAQHGLERGKNGLEIYVMCEIPNNVIQVDAFAEVFDGFSIGSNDLTQLTLGVDRDSEIVAFDFDERDPGMLEMLRLAVTGAQAQRPPCRHLRRGAGELSGDRAVPGGTRHRLDQRQPVQPGRAPSPWCARPSRRGMADPGNRVKLWARPDLAVIATPAKAGGSNPPRGGT